jgi:hypothetical protein
VEELKNGITKHEVKDGYHCWRVIIVGGLSKEATGAGGLWAISR